MSFVVVCVCCLLRYDFAILVREYASVSRAILYWESSGTFTKEIMQGMQMYRYTSACSCPVDAATGLECAGAGECVNGVCECDYKRHGDACSFRRCQNNECTDNDDCRNAINGSDYPDVCGGHGTCGDQQCFCEPGYDPETNCKELGCPGDAPSCGAFGSCVNGVCQCNTTHTGRTCELDVCNSHRAILPGLNAGNGVVLMSWKTSSASRGMRGRG